MSAARDELKAIIARCFRIDPFGVAYLDHAAGADAIIAAGYIKPDLTDADRREIAQNVILAFNGTPRHRLFEYPYRADDSHLLIAGADKAVTAVLDAMLSPEQSA